MPILRQLPDDECFEEILPGLQTAEVLCCGNEQGVAHGAEAQDQEEEVENRKDNKARE